jgi:hypothetical protein
MHFNNRGRLQRGRPRKLKHGERRLLEVLLGALEESGEPGEPPGVQSEALVWEEPPVWVLLRGQQRVDLQQLSDQSVESHVGVEYPVAGGGSKRASPFNLMYKQILSANGNKDRTI